MKALEERTSVVFDECCETGLLYEIVLLRSSV